MDHFDVSRQWWSGASLLSCLQEADSKDTKRELYDMRQISYPAPIAIQSPSLCAKCGHKQSYHHANDIQILWDDTRFHRTCYGIACMCGEMFEWYPHVPLKAKHAQKKKKKHWFLRYAKRQRIALAIMIKKIRKRLHRKVSGAQNRWRRKRRRRRKGL